MDDLGRALNQLADRTVATNPKGYTRVAIDGIDAAGKTRLVGELAPLIEARGRPVVRASIDDFLRPTTERYRQGRYSPRGYYEDSFDLAAIRRKVLDAPGPGGDAHTVGLASASGDRTERRLAPTTQKKAVGDSGVLLFDGVFLMQPELDGCWDFRVFVRVSFATSLRRALARDIPALGDESEVRLLYETRYHPGQCLYLDEVRPEDRAEAVLVNDDPARPELLLRR